VKPEEMMDRRNFLKNSAVGMAGAGMSARKSLLGAEEKSEGGDLKIKEYRTLGRTGFKVSDINAGGPMDEGILNALLDAGVNYIDTAESYGNGKSETIIGNVMKNRDRESVFITTKQIVTATPGYPVKKEDVTKQAIIKRFQKSLERMQTDYADCLMMHGTDSVSELDHKGFHAAVGQLKADGKLKYAGISYHGAFAGMEIKETMGQVLLAAAEDGRFDVFLMTHNYLRQEQSEKVLKVCKAKTIGTTLMKTDPVARYFMIKEGIERLEKEEKEIPEMYRKALEILKEKYDKAQEFLRKYELEYPTEMREAAIKFCLSNPDANSICVRFQNFKDVERYVRLSGKRLTPTDHTALDVFAKSFGQFYCRHACGICESKCPHHIPINTIMRYNHYFTGQGREKYAMGKYAKLNTEVANHCMNCDGRCQTECPYAVPIQTLLVLADQNLTLA
jgi:aryl-alcohol dehydrogenase-like predicted oxidoreductase